MAEKIRLSTLEGAAFHPLHRALKEEKYDEYWLMGGRGSGKSSFISLEIVLGMLRDKNANAIVYRKVAAQMRTSVYAQMRWAISKLGMESLFKFYKSPLQIECVPTGQKILFRGADDPGKSKSIKPEKGYFKYLWFEELTEFGGMEDVRTIKISVFRQEAKAVTFYSYNPPRSLLNWVNGEGKKVVPGRLTHISDYTMMPPEWLGEAFLKDAEYLKNTNESAYRNIYLGEITGNGGQVFDNLCLRPIDADERNGFDRILNGLDFGFANDPDAFLRLAFNRNTATLFIFEELYAKKMSAQALCERLRERIGNDVVICDSSEPRMIAQLRECGIQAMPAKKGPGSIQHGIRFLQDLYQIVIDPGACPNAAREFEEYEYQRDRGGEFMAAFYAHDDHTIDAARYALESMMNQRTAKVMNRDLFLI
jgi:phage terminase, large subunit, PBSX family